MGREGQSSCINDARLILLFFSFVTFLDATTHLCKRSYPSVLRSVYEGERSSINMIYNDTFRDDEVLVFCLDHLCNRCIPTVVFL